MTILLRNEVKVNSELQSHKFTSSISVSEVLGIKSKLDSVSVFPQIVVLNSLKRKQIGTHTQ